MNRMDWPSPCLILSSIHRAKPLHSWLVCNVVWIIWNAEVVGTSSSVAVPASSSPSCIHQLSSSDIWTAGFSPPCVDHSTIFLDQGHLLLLALLSVQLVLEYHWHLTSPFLPYLRLVPEVPSLLSVLEAHEDQVYRLAHLFHPSHAAPQCR